MSIFDSLQNLLGGAVDSVQGSIGDVAGGITDNPIVQDVQDQVSSIADGAPEAVNTATDLGQTAIDDTTQNLGL